MVKRWFMWVLVAALLAAPAHAAYYSRDFGTDDAERLAKLATAELGDAPAYRKANLMLGVLKMVHEQHMTIAAAVTHYPSAERGTYIGTTPDTASWQAVEMIYQGYGEPDRALLTITRIVRILEYALPMLLILTMLSLATLASIGLSRLQRRLGGECDD